MNIVRSSGLCSIALVSALALAGCATYGNPGYGSQGNQGYSSAPAGYNGGGRCTPSSCGTVQNVQRVNLGSGGGHGTLGAVIGAVAGGLLGNTVGKGDGRKAATVVGAVAGGVVGNRVGDRQGSGEVGYQVTLRLDDGRYATITQREDPNLRQGDYAMVSGDHVYRR